MSSSIIALREAGKQVKKVVFTLISYLSLFWPMRIYYSHAMPIYGTERERLERFLITQLFPGSEIVDPGAIQNNPEKQRRQMEYCLELVDTCDSVVYTRFMDVITAGVGKEVNHALSRGKPVHELQGVKVVQIIKPVDHLSREETIALYFGLRVA
jgi:hypothetical protein